MTLKKITKVKGSVQDLAIGYGKLQQNRAGKVVEVDKISMLLIVPTIGDVPSYSEPGMVVQTRGELAEDDGNGALYVIDATEGVIQLSNGYYLKLVPIKSNPNAGSTNFNSPSSDTNIVNKYVGKMVYDTTSGRPVWASGPLATDTWDYSDGTTAYTPS